MKAKSLILLMCGIVSTVAVSAATPSKPNTMHYELRLKSDSFGDMGVRKMWIKGNSFRWEAKSERLPLCLVKNRDGLYLIHPWKKMAAQYPKESTRGNPKILFPGPTGSVDTYLKTVSAKKRGAEKVSGQKCLVYTYTEPILKRPATMWVGASSGKPVRIRIVGKNKQVDTITATYTKFEMGAPVSDRLFELPKGYALRKMPKLLASKTSTRKPAFKRPG